MDKLKVTSLHIDDADWLVLIAIQPIKDYFKTIG